MKMRMTKKKKKNLARRRGNRVVFHNENPPSNHIGLANRKGTPNHLHQRLVVASALFVPQAHHARESGQQ